MPTENEYKFVLRLDCEELIQEHHNLISILQLTQGYVRGGMPRLRESTVYVDLDQKKIKSNYVLCYKESVKNRLIEIETAIDKRDFDDLWTLTTKRLTKFRYKLKFGKDIWEIDFFVDKDGKTYFVMAEIELPEKVKPKKLRS